jgi:hypothetical protein
MKLSISILSILLTSTLAVSLKRQNDIPSCIEGDAGDAGGPYQTSQSNSRPFFLSFFLYITTNML